MLAICLITRGKIGELYLVFEQGDSASLPPLIEKRRKHGRKLNKKIIKF